MIDQMYRRPTPSGMGAYPTPAATPPFTSPTSGINPQLASSLLQSVASQAAGAGSSSGSSGGTSAASLTSPLHISTNQASLDHIIATHRATAVLISNGGSQALERILEETARVNTTKVGLAVVKMDAQVGSAKEVVDKYSLSELPGLLLFRGEQCVRVSAVVHLHLSTFLTLNLAIRLLRLQYLTSLSFVTTYQDF